MEVNVKKVFPIRLKELREELNLSQAELAENLGISRGSVSFYENGSRLPDIDVIQRMCNFFSVTSDYLIGLCNAKNIENAPIVNTTGLSQKAIEILNNFLRMNENNPVTFINRFIETADFFSLSLELRSLAEFYNSYSLQSDRHTIHFKDSSIDGPCLEDTKKLCDEVKRVYGKYAYIVSNPQMWENQKKFYIMEIFKSLVDIVTHADEFNKIENKIEPLLLNTLNLNDTANTQ